MKKVIILIAYVISTIGILHSQSPDKMSYQAVIRNSDNKLISNQIIGIQISILQGSADGIPVYSEILTPSTNDNGLISIEIGGGEGFDTIKWTNGPYFLKTEIDPEGGTIYTITGTSQLLSVPYALHSKTAELLMTKEPLHFIGERYGGGIVFWTTPDGQHGLIASLHDLDAGNGVVWSNIVNIGVGISARDFYDGSKNTAAIINQSGHTNSAAKLCDDYSYEGFNDWYLPSIFELRQMVDEAIIINYTLANDGDGLTEPLNFSSGTKYWSSTEYSSDLAYSESFVALQSKISNFRVRAIRSF